MASSQCAGASMDASQFDTLTKTLATPGTRPTLFPLLAIVPVAEGLHTLLTPDDVLSGTDGKDGKGRNGDSGGKGGHGHKGRKGKIRSRMSTSTSRVVG